MLILMQLLLLTDETTKIKVNVVCCTKKFANLYEQNGTSRSVEVVEWLMWRSADDRTIAVSRRG